VSQESSWGPPMNRGDSNCQCTHQASLLAVGVDPDACIVQRPHQVGVVEAQATRTHSRQQQAQQHTSRLPERT
jgi:hypothetical protein